MQTRRKLVCLYFFQKFKLTYGGLELWRIFHDELDLDGSGRLESDELYFALQKAGEQYFSTLSRVVNI